MLTATLITLALGAATIALVRLNARRIARRAAIISALADIATMAEQRAADIACKHYQTLRFNSPEWRAAYHDARIACHNASKARRAFIAARA